MRTTTHCLTLAAAALTFVSGCTVKGVDTPALGGPSTFAHSIVMVADRDSLTQNGSDFTDIRITSTGPSGQSENIALRAQIFVDDVAQDFGTLSSKSPITPATIRYTAPAASTLAAGQVPTTVTITVTPMRCASASTPSSCSDIGNDARGEVLRQIDIRLIPQGIILPTNPGLSALFNPPLDVQLGGKVLDVLAFDATASTISTGTPCGPQCTYGWNFGDGTSGSGQVTSHQYRAIGTYQVTLTVTDFRGAQAFLTRPVVVAPGTPPASFVFTISPAPPVAPNVDVFFNASTARAQPGRTIVSYSWSFGDGSSGTGVTTSHRYSAVGAYQVTVTVTDDAGASLTTAPQSVQVTSTAASAELTATPSSQKVGGRIVFDASASKPSTGATIVSYKFDYGDGSPTETSANPVQGHVYLGVGTFPATVEITDSSGKVATKTVSISVTP